MVCYTYVSSVANTPKNQMRRVYISLIPLLNETLTTLVFYSGVCYPMLRAVYFRV